MPHHREDITVPYPPQQMFDLVADVARYPEFLPWCRAARILEQGDGWFMAELAIAYKGFGESYTSRVTLTPPDLSGHGAIDVEMVRGPFHHLTNRWRFSPEGGGTRIAFELDFAFRSRMLEMMMGGFFTKATDKMGQAFRERADALYGKD